MFDWDFDRMYQYLPPGLAEILQGPTDQIEQIKRDEGQKQLIVFAGLAAVIWFVFFSKAAR